MDPWRFHRDSPKESVPLDLLPRLAEMASSQDENEVRQGVLLIRKLLAVEENPPIQAVVEAGVCERLVACMQHPDSELQLDASLALSSVAAGGVSHTQYVVDQEAVSVWLEHLSSPGVECKEQTAWALKSGEKRRDYLLRAGAMPALLNIIETCPPENHSLLQAAVSAVANLCRFQPPPALNHIAPAVPMLAQTIQHPDTEIASDSLWSLSYICDGSDDRVQLVIDSGVAPLVAKILDSPNEKFHRPALRIIGNICSGTDKQTQLAINSGCLRSLSQYLDPQTHKGVRKEAVYIISNICAGNSAQIQAVIEAGLLPAIVSTISDPESEVRKEAVWACANLATNGTSEQIRMLVEAGALEALCRALSKDTDVKTTTVALECILAVVESGAELARHGTHATNIYVDRIRNFQGETAIEGLLSHSDAEVQFHAQTILDDFEEGVSDEDIVS